MKKILFNVIAMVICLPAVINASDFLCNVYGGYGQLLRPDAVNSTGADLLKGGVEVMVNGLWGNERLKFGAETGVLEAYTNWDKNGSFNSKYSLSYIPLNAIVQYEFAEQDEVVVPFIFVGPGAYFKIEGGSSAQTIGGGSQTNSSRACFGMTSGIGIRWKAFSKVSINIGGRYSYVNDSDNVSLISPFLGVTTRVSFLKKERNESLKLPIKQSRDK
jgi:opacity protein-like surface antigen